MRKYQKIFDSYYMWHQYGRNQTQKQSIILLFKKYEKME